MNTECTDVGYWYKKRCCEDLNMLKLQHIQLYDRCIGGGKLEQYIATSSSSSSERQQDQAEASSSSINANRTGGVEL